MLSAQSQTREEGKEMRDSIQIHPGVIGIDQKEEVRKQATSPSTGTAVTGLTKKREAANQSHFLP